MEHPADPNKASGVVVGETVVEQVFNRRFRQVSKVVSHVEPDTVPVPMRASSHLDLFEG